ncbi:hypothetical protein [Paenibacillus sp. CF384]|uniref:hypothetical protein n=1 Tax=Paenibacillus sp. CF384 TaxID=1884382 RepID=UPI000899F085|nr:hypothetical protein [Paenibacillus sp. CF384]SDX79958.1 hypothetical protein SAMN05518855_102227 [Paenibacillus sp. CF384]
MNKLSRNLGILTVLGTVFVTSVLPASAAIDPNVSTNAYINYSQSSSTYVRGKAYAVTTNSNMQSLNVNGVFSQGGVQKESGVGSTTTIGSEAAWYTKDLTYKANVSCSLSVASRTYYKNGTSSDQSYSNTTW